MRGSTWHNLQEAEGKYRPKNILCARDKYVTDKKIQGYDKRYIDTSVCNLNETPKSKLLRSISETPAVLMQTYFIGASSRVYSPEQRTMTLKGYE